MRNIMSGKELYPPILSMVYMHKGQVKGESERERVREREREREREKVGRNVYV